MFESLDEHIKHDLQAEEPTSKRMIRYAMIAAVSVVAVGGLFAAIHLVK